MQRPVEDETAFSLHPGRRGELCPNHKELNFANDMNDQERDFPQEPPKRNVVR